MLTDFDWDTTNGPVIVKDIAVRAHAAGKKAILMLGGAGEGAAIRAAVLNHRAAFVANLVAAMKTYGYDGLDLDWEDEVDWPAFVGFVRDLRNAAPKAILTMPVGALNLNYQTVQPEIATMAASLDRLAIMSYYPSTAWAGSGWLSWFNSPLDGEKGAKPVSIASSLQAYAAAGIPKAKLAMGASFYAICYSGGITKPNQSTDAGVEIRAATTTFRFRPSTEEAAPTLPPIANGTGQPQNPTSACRRRSRMAVATSPTRTNNRSSQRVPSHAGTVTAAASSGRSIRAMSPPILVRTSCWRLSNAVS